MVNHSVAMGLKLQLHPLTEGFSIYNILKCIHNLQCIERRAEFEELRTR
jgi:hypothetical protein